MKKPCSTCDSLIVVNGKSFPNPQCHSCRAKARLGNCEECAKPMDRGKPSAIRRFCSRQCFGASGLGNASRSAIKMLNCDWCDKSYTYTSEHKDNKYSICSRRCAYNLRMKPSSPWKPPRVVVPKVEKVIKIRTCKDCQAEIDPKQHRCNSCRETAAIKYRRKKHTYDRQRKKLKGDSSSNRKRARKYGCAYETINKIQVFVRDNYTCHICGQTADPTAPVNSARYPSLDHIIPMSKQGGHLYSNVATACFMCNSLKRDLDLDEARLVLARHPA